MNKDNNKSFNSKNSTVEAISNKMKETTNGITTYSANEQSLKYHKLSEIVLSLTNWDDKTLCSMYDKICAPDFCLDDVSYVMNRLTYDALVHLKDTKPDDYNNSWYLDEAITLAHLGEVWMEEIKLKEMIKKENQTDNTYNIFYQGKNIEFKTMKCCIMTELGFLIGDNLYIVKMDGETIKNDKFPEGAIWVMKQNDDFQTIENFCKGIEFIDNYATPLVREKCFSLLWELRAKNLGIKENFKRVAFFCEVGVWENKDIRNPRLYNPKFLKYLYNVRWNYQLAE